MNLENILHIMGMKFWYSIFLLFLFLATLTQAQQPDCKPVRCSSSGPNISFPFYLKGQSQECGIPGFGLICRSDTTTIKFPSHGDLVLKSISYRDRRLDLLDPRNCVHEVFLNLNLSQTPFKYYYSLKSYTYVNCSEPENPSRYQLLEIPCLSGPGHHVYTIEGSRAALEVANQDRPSSCKVVKTVDIPFPYSPYLSDNSFGLRLTWELADSCGGCKGRGSRDGVGGLPINQITGAARFTILILIIMASLVRMKIHRSQDLDQDEHVAQARKLLGESAMTDVEPV